MIFDHYFDYIVVGAGLTGAVMAERIASALDKKVLIIEKRPHIGGNCFDTLTEHGIYIHKYGPHIFHTDNERVFGYLSRFTEWIAYIHKVLGIIHGQKTPIPFNLNSLYRLFPQEMAKDIENALLNEFAFGSSVSVNRLLNSNDSNISMLGNFIYENVFLNYTIKQWGLSPDEIDASVLDRVPVRISRDDSYFSDKYQTIPKNGYTSMLNKMLAHPNIHILLKTDFKELIHLDASSCEIKVMGMPFNGQLIYTGPIDYLFDYQVGRLEYRALNFEFEVINRQFFQETATVNYPNHYDFTRITEFKHFHRSQSPFTVILREYPMEYKGENDSNEHGGKNNASRLIPCYPVLTYRNKEAYRQYRGLSRRFSGLTLIGRLAEYKYYDMDDAVEAAISCFEKDILPLCTK